jgi:integrase
MFVYVMPDRKDEREKNIKFDGGRTYLRPTESQKREGKRLIRIYAERGTEAYYNEIEAARLIMGTSSQRLPGHDLGWLMTCYMRSPEYRSLGDSTRKVRATLLNHCAEHLGRTRSFNSVVKAEIRALRDSMADRPEAANARVKALRQVYKWAVSCDLSENNPAANVPYLPSNNPHGFHTWTEREIELYESVHETGTVPRLAIDILQFTGVRRSDAVLLGPPNERQGMLEFTEQKNRERQPKERIIPILPELRRSIDATPIGRFTYLVTQFKRPFTRAGFGNWFKKRCREANLEHCSAHGIRKAAAVKAAMGGATTSQLMAIFGWDSSKMAEHYTKAAERNRLARESMHLLRK